MHVMTTEAKPLDRPLVAGCRIGHKPCLLHVSGRDKKVKELVNSVKDGFCLGGSYQPGVTSSAPVSLGLIHVI